MKQKSAIYKFYPLLLLIAFIITIIQLTKCATQSDIEQLKNYPKVCGYFFKSGCRKSGCHAYFRYMVNKKVYEMNGGSFDPRNLGNYYSIAYDSLDPEYGAMVDWSEQWIKQGINNIYVWVKNVAIDSVPSNYGWRKITYSYIIGNKEYEGTRALKEKFYKKVNLNSLQ